MSGDDPETGSRSEENESDESDENDEESGETRWIVQWSEPFGANEAKRVVDTEAEAEAVVEAMEERYESVEDEPGLYRVELKAEVYFTTVEVPYGPLPDDW